MISENQLKTWTHQGAVTSAKETLASVQHALNSYSWPDGIGYEVYLQGSYKNTTNIRGDSDVDVVVQLNSGFYSNLTEEQKRRRQFTKGRYSFRDFRYLVSDAISHYYRQFQIEDNNKCFRVTGTRLPADVVPCVQYRNYKNPDYSNSYVQGMTFWTKYNAGQIINYPKIHYDNGVNKHQTTHNYYKPTVRMFKNIRTYLANKNMISTDLVPSYFLECLIYNVPTDKFSWEYQQTFCNVVNWLASTTLTNLVCENEQLNLFGSTEQQWQTDAADQFITNAAYLWENFS